MPERAASQATRVRWPDRAGGWLGIGTSPGALVLGAGIAARHDGGAPLVALLVGAAAMAAMLVAQGLLGLAPPLGEGDTLGSLAGRYLQARSARVLGVLLTAAMVGWMGFNSGLGGAALAALLGLPGPAGTLLLGGALTAIALGGMRRWNSVAIVTTICALLLTGLVAVRLAAPVSPVTIGAASPGSVLADVSAFLGYVAVFSLRAPDFSVGLSSRRDLAICAALLVCPTLLIALAGVGLWLGTGSSDLVATLAQPGALALGNLLVAAAVIAPTFATLYSGGLAVRSVSELNQRAGLLWVALPGLALGMMRFDRLLLTWLALLAAALPPLVVPMAAEGTRRRRERLAGLDDGGRLVPLWTWAPGALLAMLLTALGVAPAPLLGVAVTMAATGIWTARTGR